MAVPVTMMKTNKYAVRTSAVSSDVMAYLKKGFGCARKVYNLYVDSLFKELDAAGYTGGSELPAIKLPEVTEFKRQFPYLKETDSLALANVKIDFSRAVDRYNGKCDHVSYRKSSLKRANAGNGPLTFRDLKGMPRFHKKGVCTDSYTTNCQYPGDTNSLKRPTIRLEGDILYLPKMKEGLRLILHRPMPDNAVIKTVTVSMDTDGHIFVSISYQYTVKMKMNIREACVAGDNSIIDRLTFLGLDYSQEYFYVDSEGRKANCPKSYRCSEEKLARLQKDLSRMQKGSKNYERQLAKIQRCHVKIRNQRLDFVRKEALRLSREYDVVVVEDINLRAIGGSLHLGKNLHDNGFGMFRDHLERKLREKGSILVKVDKWFPSTKTCSVCGYVNPEVKLGVQEWECPECGTVHQRDPNAAVNIREEGKRSFISYFRNAMDEEEKARQRAEKLHSARKAGRHPKAAA